jgi:hypothetical protein
MLFKKANFFAAIKSLKHIFFPKDYAIGDLSTSNLSRLTKLTT